jgi:hypothetical protein
MIQNFITESEVTFLNVTIIISVDWGCCGRNSVVVGFTTIYVYHHYIVEGLLWSYGMQSVSITTKVVNSNSDHGELYSIQHYVIKFGRDLWQVGGFLHR